MLGHGKKCLCLLTKGAFLMPRTLEMNFLFPFVSFDDRKNYLKIHAALVKFIVIFFFCFVE